MQGDDDILVQAYAKLLQAKVPGKVARSLVVMWRRGYEDQLEILGNDRKILYIFIYIYIYTQTCKLCMNSFCPYADPAKGCRQGSGHPELFGVPHVQDRE